MGSLESVEEMNTFTSSWTARWPPQPITWAPAHHILTEAAQRQSFRLIRLEMKMIKKKRRKKIRKTLMLGAYQPMTPFSGGIWGFREFLRKMDVAEHNFCTHKPSVCSLVMIAGSLIKQCAPHNKKWACSSVCQNVVKYAPSG